MAGKFGPFQVTEGLCQGHHCDVSLIRQHEPKDWMIIRIRFGMACVLSVLVAASVTYSVGPLVGSSYTGAAAAAMALAIGALVCLTQFVVALRAWVVRFDPIYIIAAIVGQTRKLIARLGIYRLISVLLPTQEIATGRLLHGWRLASSSVASYSFDAEESSAFTLATKVAGYLTRDLLPPPCALDR